MVVSTEEEYKELKTKTEFTFVCRKCGKEITIKKGTSTKSQESQIRFLCRKCKTEETCLKVYGVTSISQAKEVKEKVKKTNLERYGTTCSLHNQEIAEKSRRTNLERYGKEWASQSDEFRSKVIQTAQKKYGVNNVFQNEEVKKKIKETCLETYGTENAAQSEEVKEKMKGTCEEKYGFPSYFQSPEFQEKSKKTCIEKYGAPHYSQTLEFHKTHRGKYEYDGLIFDSSWELLFYKHYKSMGADIIYHPCYFEYEFENKKHRYFPDFSVNGELIEIKGDHFMKDGKMICPFKDKRYPPEYLNAFYQAKYECAIKNNVRFFFEKDLKELFGIFQGPAIL